jgi:hypothetical protein
MAQPSVRVLGSVRWLLHCFIAAAAASLLLADTDAIVMCLPP